jgi:hypothetical protein
MERRDVVYLQILFKDPMGAPEEDTEELSVNIANGTIQMK